MIERTGSLFDTEAPAIGHGVNCAGVMGAGIAVLFKRTWPAMFEEYRHACMSSKLTPGGLLPYRDGRGRVIYNLASQDRPGPHASLDLVRQSVADMIQHATAHGITRIALPRIGCGIGGLDWPDVKAILCSAETDFVEFEIWALTDAP